MEPEPLPALLVSGRWSEPEQQPPQSVPWRPGAELQVSGVRDSMLPADFEPGAPGLERSASEVGFQNLFVQAGESTHLRRAGQHPSG